MDMELVSRRFADTVVLFPEGRIDHATAEQFKAALAPHLATCAEGRDRVVIDMSGVEYISSVGLRVLMLAAKQAKAQGVRTRGVRAPAGGARDLRDQPLRPGAPGASPRCARRSPRSPREALAAFEAA